MKKKRNPRPDPKGRGKQGKKQTPSRSAKKADKTLARAFYLIMSLPDDFDIGDRDDPPQERDWM